jgi:hypothetical protein
VVSGATPHGWPALPHGHGTPALVCDTRAERERERERELCSPPLLLCPMHAAKGSRTLLVADARLHATPTTRNSLEATPTPCSHLVRTCVWAYHSIPIPAECPYTLPRPTHRDHAPPCESSFSAPQLGVASTAHCPVPLLACLDCPGPLRTLLP